MVTESRLQCNGIIMWYSFTFQKIESALASNMYDLENSKTIETAITQHFAHLHGVLQNMEAKLMSQLYQQRDSLKSNLENIDLQLRSQEERLKVTLQVRFFQKLKILVEKNICLLFASMTLHITLQINLHIILIFYLFYGF